MPWCLKNGGTQSEYIVGDSCPVGYTQTSGPTISVDGAKTASGDLPSAADKRPVGTQQYIGSQLGMGSGSTVYETYKAFEQMRVTDPSAYRGIVKRMREAGLLTSREKSDVTIARKYRLLVEASAQSVEEGNPQTPMQILGGLIEGGGVDSGAERSTGVGAYTGPRYTTEISSDTGAYTLLNTMARDMLGRDLTEQEVKKYTQQLRQAEMESPQVATPQGRAGTVYSGGVDRNEVVRQLITENPDYAGFQLNHQVMDTILADLDEGQAFLNEWS